MTNETDFGKELLETCKEFVALAELAQRTGGFRDKSRARALSSEINCLAAETRTLMEGACVTQVQVDLLTQSYRNLMGRVFDEMKASGTSSTLQ